eukprot:1143253-Pelagomonas_calceolata.AAC.5
MLLTIFAVILVHIFCAALASTGIISPNSMCPKGVAQRDRFVRSTSCCPLAASHPILFSRLEVQNTSYPADLSGGPGMVADRWLTRSEVRVFGG